MAQVQPTLVTSTELYNITSSPKFVSETSADNDGNYIQVWEHAGKKYQVNRNLCDWRN